MMGGLSEGANFLSVGSELPRAEGTILSEGGKIQSAQVWVLGDVGCQAPHRCFS